MSNIDHLRQADPNHFVVVFRTGGTENCEWKATVPFASGNVADAKAAEIRTGGRKALVKRVGEVVEHGLPVGWEAVRVPQRTLMLSMEAQWHHEDECRCDIRDMADCPRCGVAR